MLKKTLAAAAVILTLAAPAHAGTTFGMPDCGQWTASPTATRKAWLLGYLSGAADWQNFATQLNSNGQNMGPDVLSKVNSAEQIYAWMTNYCRENPMRDVSDGAFVLMAELTKPSGKKK